MGELQVEGKYRPSGRPPLHGEPMHQVALMLTNELDDYLKRAAAARAMSKSRYLRVLLEEDRLKREPKAEGVLSKTGV